MAAFFLDASALVKRYATETGTTWMTGLLDPAARNRLYRVGALSMNLKNEFALTDC